MSLKFRYASMLLAVLALLVFGVYEALLFMQMEMYWQLAVLAVVLYGVMFFCGKKMTNIFVLLSMLSYIRKQGGVVDETTCRDFIHRSLPKKSESQRDAIWALVKTRLVDGKMVEIVGHKIRLLG